jgi:hypothetical protein
MLGLVQRTLGQYGTLRGRRDELADHDDESRARICMDAPRYVHADGANRLRYRGRCAIQWQERPWRVRDEEWLEIGIWCPENDTKGYGFTHWHNLRVWEIDLIGEKRQSEKIPKLRRDKNATCVWIGGVNCFLEWTISTNDVRGCVGNDNAEFSGNGPCKGGRVRAIYLIGTLNLEHTTPTIQQ